MTVTPELQAKAVVASAVSETLNRQDVPIESKDVPIAAAKTTAAVVDAINRSDTVAIVPVESPWTSKINITQVITALFGLLAGFGLPIPDGTKVAVLQFIVVVGPVVTVVFKTFFSKGIPWTSK